MRYKSVAAMLALVLGVFGIHRFYLGQFLRGLLYLIYPLVTLTIIFQATGFLQVVKEEASFSMDGGIAPFLLLFVLIPLFDCIWLLAMSQDKFNKRYNHHPLSATKTILFAVLVLIAGAGFNLLAYQQFYQPDSVKVAGSKADIKVAAEELASEFTNNEEAALEKFKGKITQVTGKVETEETQLGKEGDQRVLILSGDGNLAVRCEFNTGEKDKVQEVEMGETITVIGAFRELMVFEAVLEDCYLVESEH